MSEFKTILLDHDGKVSTITLNRPVRMNSLTAEMFDEVSAAIDAAMDGGARCLVITGAGERAFCTGADLQDRLETGVPDDLGQMVEDYYNPLALKLAGLDIPLVTAVNGAAAGAGCSLAVSGDISVMGRSSYLLMAFVNVGLVPDLGGLWYIAKSAGRAKAMEMALLGERLYAERALEWGLVNRVVDDGEVLPEAMKIAHRLAKGPTVSIAHIRKQVAHALTHSLPEVLVNERYNQRTCGQTLDFRAALDAFMEKRKVEFQGR